MKLDQLCADLTTQGRLTEQAIDRLLQSVDRLLEGAYESAMSGKVSLSWVAELAKSRGAAIVSTEQKCAGCDGPVAWCVERAGWRCFACEPRRGDS